MKIPPLPKLLRLLRDNGVESAHVTATEVRVTFAPREAKQKFDNPHAQPTKNPTVDDIELALNPAPEPKYDDESPGVPQ